MNNDINNNVESQAEQCEWLDVSYTARRYSDEQAEGVATVSRGKGKRKGSWKMVALSVLTVFVLVSAVFVGMNGGWDGVTEIYLASVFSSSDSDTSSNIVSGSYESIDLPYNVDIVTVEGGVVTFDGGSIVVSFTEGTVTAVGDSTVTVAIDDSTSIVYGNISECYVVVGTELEYCDVIGKYTDTATVSLYSQDVVVTNLVGSDYILQWSV